MCDSVLEFVINSIVALLTGISTGLVVSRMARFEELRNEARRIVWGIDYIYGEGARPRVTEQRPVGELLYVSSELYALKHASAGGAVSDLLQEITATLYSPPADAETMNRRYLDWQRTCRELKPDRRVIFSIGWKP